MAITKIHPYLMFDGNARDAIALYEKALGAKVENLMRFGDVPAGPQGPGCADDPENASRILHACLRIGDAVVMLSDGPAGVPAPKETNVQVSLELDDVRDLEARFDALAAGGKVGVAPHDAFWGARFGMLTDAFGIRWMLSCNAKRG